MTFELDETFDFEQFARDVLTRITYKPGYSVVCLRDADNEGGRLYYQAHVQRVDIVTDKMGTGKGGKSYLSRHMTVSELVRKAFGLLLAYEEHECREHFKFDGERVFGPHIDVLALKEVAQRIDARTPPESQRSQDVRRAWSTARHLQMFHPDITGWEDDPLAAHNKAHADGKVHH